MPVDVGFLWGLWDFALHPLICIGVLSVGLVHRNQSHRICLSISWVVVEWDSQNEPF